MLHSSCKYKRVGQVVFGFIVCKKNDEYPYVCAHVKKNLVKRSWDQSLGSPSRLLVSLVIRSDSSFHLEISKTAHAHTHTHTLSRPKSVGGPW